jgi:hypothetical protein
MVGASSSRELRPHFKAPAKADLFASPFYHPRENQCIKRSVFRAERMPPCVEDSKQEAL